MKRYLVLAVLILTASLAGQVEHAPTVAQCEADQRLWFAQIEADAKAGNDTLPTVDVIGAWHTEMHDCEAVDPANRVRYYNTESEIIVEQMLRLQHFVSRHQLHSQFLAEDAAGKR
jgi:hypothetical protein